MNEIISDSTIQKAIAERLWVYADVDLKIPAQRRIANQVRASFDLPPLTELDESGFSGMEDAGFPTNKLASEKGDIS